MNFQVGAPNMTEHPLAPTFGLAFHDAESLRHVMGAMGDRVLGVIAYGKSQVRAESDGHPFAWVGMPVIGDGIRYEVWTSQRSVNVKHHDALCVASDGDMLFGSLTLDEQAHGTLEVATREAYAMIFDAIDREAYPHLLRVWNYFPRINESERGLERYRNFSVGRHDAFVDKRLAILEADIPAACALGSGDGPLVIYFMASKTPGLPLENPRQVRAYRYPPEFGPRSPTFSRAMLVGSALLISGTSSIQGSQTVHPHEVSGQLEETIINLRAVIGEARTHGFCGSAAQGICLKVYLRHAQDCAQVHERLKAEFGHAACMVFLQADVCRHELMIEIEMSWLSSIGSVDEAAVI